MNTVPQSIRVIQLYRQILKLGKNWKAKEETNTVVERQQIITEARQAFREHQQVFSFSILMWKLIIWDFSGKRPNSDWQTNLSSGAANRSSRTLRNSTCKTRIPSS